MLALADDAALAHLVIAATAIPGVHGLRTPDILKAPTKHHRPYSMPPPRRRRLGSKPDRRRALELLAASHDGASEAIMLAHGFTVEQLVELVRSGLASATPERVVAGKRAIQIT